MTDKKKADRTLAESQELTILNTTCGIGSRPRKGFEMSEKDIKKTVSILRANKSTNRCREILRTYSLDAVDVFYAFYGKTAMVKLAKEAAKFLKAYSIHPREVTRCLVAENMVRDGTARAVGNLLLRCCAETVLRELGEDCENKDKESEKQ